MTAVLATRNQDKVREIREILGEGIPLRSLRDYPQVPEIPEDGCTFRENAVGKARFVSGILSLAALADDSGLEVDALNGDPGVRSARFAGEGSTAAQNNTRLLQLMAGIPPERRGGRFRCVVALALPDGTVRTAEGACEGRILEAPRGSRGFGYDPLFVPDGYDRTFAELDPEEKNRISHRARALEAARGMLRECLRPGP
jgi:XTP/dITP diphosphohydrolase